MTQYWSKIRNCWQTLLVVDLFLCNNLLVSAHTCCSDFNPELLGVVIDVSPAVLWSFDTLAIMVRTIRLNRSESQIRPQLQLASLTKSGFLRQAAVAPLIRSLSLWRYDTHASWCMHNVATQMQAWDFRMHVQERLGFQCKSSFMSCSVYQPRSVSSFFWLLRSLSTVISLTNTS